MLVIRSGDRTWRAKRRTIAVLSVVVGAALAAGSVPALGDEIVPGAGLGDPLQAPPSSASQDASASIRASDPTPPEAPPLTGPLAVKFLNPFAVGDNAPRISDKSIGDRKVYHVVAVVSSAPSEAIVEGYIAPEGKNERSIGTLSPTADDPHTFELLWNMPEALSNGPAVMRVRLFENTVSGPELRAVDEIAVRLSHHDEPCPLVSVVVCTPTPAAATVALTAPAASGGVGFYRAPDGKWYGVVDGIGSPDASGQFQILYSTQPLHSPPAFRECGTKAGVPRESDGARLFAATCALTGTDVPSMVTAVAAVARRSGSADESSDAARVLPYVQHPHQMSVAIGAVAPASPSAAWPTGKRRRAESGCLEYSVVVVDELNRPVQGANVDVTLEGPKDAVSFGGTGSSETNVPDGFSVEHASNCSGGEAGEQGRLIVPGGPDVVQIESARGAGLSGPNGVAPGEFRFRAFGAAPGLTRIGAWVDDAPLGSETDARPGDNERPDPGEPLAEDFAQWLTGPIQLSFAPRSETVPLGACRRTILRATDGDLPVPGINIDVHLRGPEDEVRLCNLHEGSTVDPPGEGHPLGEDGEPAAEPSDMHPAETPDCPGEGPPCKHVQTTTDARGEIAIGIAVREEGLSELTAWVDGEPGADDDRRKSPEANANGTVRWIASVTNARVRFLNPSGFGRVDPPRIGTSPYRLVVQADAPYLVDGVDVLFSTGASGFRRIGRATRIGQSSFYEFMWNLDATSVPTPEPEPTASPEPSPSSSPSPEPEPEPTATPSPGPAGVPDGNYILRAQIPGTGQNHDVTVNVDRTGPEDDDQHHEWVHITRPARDVSLIFTERETPIEGVASAGAGEVDLFYTRSGFEDDLTWTSCGSVALEGGDEPQAFSGLCTLASGHQAGDVITIAAVAFDPTPQPVVPGLPPLPLLSSGTNDGGNAVGVVACDRVPCLTLQPERGSLPSGACQPIAVSVTGAAGPVSEGLVRIQVTGPVDGIRFCDIAGTGGLITSRQSNHSGPDTHQATGLTDGNGELVIGALSPAGGLRSARARVEGRHSHVVSWLDEDRDGIRSKTEPQGVRTIHWGLERRCSILGTKTKDKLSGTSGADVICGFGGNDTIRGRGGHDIILGGPGRDTLRGGAGNDELYGGAGNDVLRGGPGRDVLDGGQGRDRCRDTQGRNTFRRCGGSNGRAANVGRGLVP